VHLQLLEHEGLCLLRQFLQNVPLLASLFV
jgi:hypothetical protein